jgi:Type ISP C-terminal specificity domain/N-6 DNA Methylase
LRLLRNGPPLFTVLAEDWRNLLFPDATDEAFADQYAQTVTFALLLARVEGIAFNGHDVAAIAKQLGKNHSLMGKALAVLTDDSHGGLGVSLDSLVHVVGAVDWGALDDGSGDAFLHLYEDFLAIYDPKLRQQTGSYYTPNDLVRFMVGFSDQLLQSKLSLPRGFAAPEVVAVDPAMGTGTFLLHIIEQAARAVVADEGEGAVGPALRDMVKRRLIGFEKQTGPYAVAELRLYEELRRYQSTAPADGLRIYVTDTLDNPYIEQTQLGSTYEPIARSRRAANRVKRDEPVIVVIGNPPYDKATKGAGKWIETGDPGAGQSPPLDAFRAAGKGRYEYVLTNLHVYFWRWATWKVFDHHSEAPSGIVAFITTSAYLTSPGFAGMREYLRRTADQGWIVDVSPEGHRPDIPTRIFPEVAQPLCIGIFVRSGQPQPEVPAQVHYLAIAGRREQKFARLSQITLDDLEWAACPDEWQAVFRPQAGAIWATSPLLSDLFPWSSRGVTPGRTWIHAPARDALTERWRLFLAADTERRRELFGEARDRKLNTPVDPLPGIASHRGTLAQESGPHLEPVRIGYRSFERRWLIPDNRLMVVPRPDLWRVRSRQQLYIIESVRPVESGPSLTFSTYIPDMNYYKGSNGGRVFPLYRDGDGLAPNLAPKLLPYLTSRLGTRVLAEDLLAYVAGVVAHPAFTERFYTDLQVPGVRVPLTANSELWQEAVRLGQEVLWLHAYGERYADPAAGRPTGPPRLPADRRPRVITAIPDTETSMPNNIDYDPKTLTLHVGAGRIAPVAPEVWAYEVSGMNVVKKWFGYRKKDPAGRRSSRLDEVNPTSWSPQYTTELLELLNVLGRLVDLEPAQAALLEQICTAPQITIRDLEHAGVFPPPATVRKPLKNDEDSTLFGT